MGKARNRVGYKIILRGNRTPEARSQTNMRKMIIELTSEQYFFLEKALELQRQNQNQNASLVSIVRDLVEKDRQEWARRKRGKT